MCALHNHGYLFWAWEWSKIGYTANWVMAGLQVAEFVDHLIAYGFFQEDTWVPGLSVNWFRLAPGLAGHWAMDHLDSIWISIYPWFTMQILLEYYDYYQDYYRNTSNSCKLGGSMHQWVSMTLLHPTPPYPNFWILWGLCHQSNNQSLQGGVPGTHQGYVTNTSFLWPRVRVWDKLKKGKTRNNHMQLRIAPQQCCCDHCRLQMDIWGWKIHIIQCGLPHCCGQHRQNEQAQ